MWMQMRYKQTDGQYTDQSQLGPQLSRPINLLELLSLEIFSLAT